MVNKFLLYPVSLISDRLYLLSKRKHIIYNCICMVTPPSK